MRTWAFLGVTAALGLFAVGCDREAPSQVAPIREEPVSDPGTAKLKTEPGLAGRSQVNGCVNGTTDFCRIELDRCFLRAAYDRDRDDFDASHHNMGGGRVSYAMLCNARSDFDSRWGKLVRDWFLATARSELERKRMIAYGVGAADLKYTRDELNYAMRAWDTVINGRGKFLGNDLVFTNGVTRLFDRRKDWSGIGFTNGLPKVARLLKENIWVHEGNVYLFLVTDNVESETDEEGCYGGTDAEYEVWFVRFKGSRLVNYAPFRRGCGDWSDLRFHFEPDNDCIVITSIRSGNISGELHLGLTEYTDAATGKKSIHFGLSTTMVSEGDRQADAE